MKPKLLFVYDHPHPEWWMDGLSVALDVLEDDFEIERLNLHSYKDSDIVGRNAVFILGWGALGSSVDKWVQGQNFPLPLKKGLCVAGNATQPIGTENYQVLFAETSWIIDNYLPKHKNIVKSFGVNADIYAPVHIPTPVVWDYIGVGAFASWKRWEKMIEKAKQGHKCLVVGEYQKDNEQESLGIIRELVANGVMVSPQVHPLDLANLYSWSRTLYMPSDLNGGGERSVLEAVSCGLNVEIEKDNPKLQELLDNKVPSHIDYAKQLKKGIMSVL